MIEIEPTPTHTRSLANHRNRAGVDVCVSGGGFDYEVEAQPIAAIANRIVERVGHGLGLHGLRDTQISHEAVAFLVSEWADFAEGGSVPIAEWSSGPDLIKADRDTLMAERPANRVDSIDRADTQNSGRKRRAVNRQGHSDCDAQGQVAHLPFDSHLLALPRNEASGDQIGAWACQKLLVAGCAALNASDCVAQILQKLGSLLLDRVVIEYDCHLPNPRSQSPATRAAGCDDAGVVTRTVDRSAPATDHAGRSGDGQRGVYVGEARAHASLRAMSIT